MNRKDNFHSNSHETEIRTYAQTGHNSERTDSGSELNRLSGELNQRITREMSDFMDSVSSQIQRATNEAINDQILPQIQTSLKAGDGSNARKKVGSPG